MVRKDKQNQKLKKHRVHLKHEQQEFSVFFSYSHADKEVVKSLAARLENIGVRVWIDEGELRIGDSIIERISNAIKEVNFVVAIISKNSVKSNWCQKELSMAVNNGLRRGNVCVLPLKIDDEEIPPTLRDVKYLILDSENPLATVNQLFSDMLMHFRQQQRQSIHEERCIPQELSPDSLIEQKRLLRLNLELESPDDNIPWNAKETLVNDRSVPAANILYENAINDALNEMNRGYGAFGLAELGPQAAPWLYRMLTHEDNKVVYQAFYALVFLHSQMTEKMHNHLFDTIEALIEIGDWSICENRLREAVRGDEHVKKRLQYLISCAKYIKDSL